MTKQKMQTLKQQYQTQKRHSTTVAKLQESQTSKLELVAKKIREEMEAIAKMEKELEEIAEWRKVKIQVNYCFEDVGFVGLWWGKQKQDVFFCAGGFVCFLTDTMIGCLSSTKSEENGGPF